jgi:type II secretory pathway component PulJ
MPADDRASQLGPSGVRRFLRAAARAAARLTANLDLEKVLEAATGALRDDFGAAGAAVWLCDAEVLRLESSTDAKARKTTVAVAEARGLPQRAA